MTVEVTPPHQIPASFGTRYGESDYGADVEPEYGRVLFAGTPLLMLGPLRFLDRSAAIANARFL
jgi:hypothetical protein